LIVVKGVNSNFSREEREGARRKKQKKLRTQKKFFCLAAFLFIFFVYLRVSSWLKIKMRIAEKS